MPKIIEDAHDILDFLSDAIHCYESALRKAYPDRSLVPSPVLDEWDRARSYLDEAKGEE